MIRTPAHKQTDLDKLPGTCQPSEVEQYLHQCITRKQAETPKKLTFDEWLKQRFPHGVEDRAYWLSSDDFAQCWKAAQENK